MAKLQKSKLDDEIENRFKKSKGAKLDEKDDDEQDGKENTRDDNQIAKEIMSQYEEAGSGVSKPRVLMSPQDNIDDKYNNMNESSPLTNGKDKDEKRSVETVKREDFLTIVKNDGGSNV